MNKLCTKCNTEYPIWYFAVRSVSKDKITNHCKGCILKDTKQYNIDNKLYFDTRRALYHLQSKGYHIV